MNSKWITHNKTQIFNVDFSNLGQNRDALNAELQAITDVVMNQPKNSVLALVDIRNTALTAAMTLTIRRYAWRLGSYIYRAAVIDNNVSYFKMVVLNSVARIGGQEIVLFSNMEKAKDWLVNSKS